MVDADERDLLDDAKLAKIDRRKWLVASVGLLAVTLGTDLGDGVAIASNFADSNLPFFFLLLSALWFCKTWMQVCVMLYVCCVSRKLVGEWDM